MMENIKNKGNMPLDSRIKYENDKTVSSLLSSSCLTRRSRTKINYASAFRFAESGRSMAEMLGTLAIIGVLSIGGIMGYSYGMDKYRANETMQAVTLRGIDALAQFDRTGDANLNEWQNQKTVYPITLEEGTIGIQVDEVPERVCDMMAEGMTHVATGIKVNGAYVVGDINSCDGDKNSLVFYFDEESVANAPVLEQCGDIVCEQCQKCDKSTMTCVAAVENIDDMFKSSCISNGYESYCFGDVCLPVGASECDGIGDPQCVAYMEGSCQLLSAFPCEKEGQSGACSEEGICVVSSDATSCGGVNCIELYQESFNDRGYAEGGYYLPTQCIGCFDGQCSTLPFCRANGDMYFCQSSSIDAICQRICSKNSDCGECEKCDGGICKAAQVNCEINGQAGVCGSYKECIPLPEDNTCGGEICEGDVGCSYCKNNTCQMVSSNIACEKNGKDGYCQLGYCLPMCTSKNDCSANQFCGSPNNSEQNQYVDGNIGVCKDFDFIPITHDGKTYYLSKDRYSWWDAQAICGQYNNLSLITKEEVVLKASDWDGTVLTELGTKILNELDNYDPVIFDYDTGFQKEDGNIRLAHGLSDEKLYVKIRVVCR